MKKREKFSQNLNKRLSKYLSDNFEVKYDEASTTEKGDAFCAIYVNDFLTRSFNLDEIGIEDGLAVAGPGDLGIDFIYEGDDFFLITQAKWKDSGSLKEGDILEFVELFKNKIFDKEKAEDGNSRIQEYLIDVRNNKKTKKIFFDFIFNRVFTRTQKKLIEKQTEKIKTYCSKNKVAQPIVSFIDVDGLNEQQSRIKKSKTATNNWHFYVKEYSDKLVSNKLESDNAIGLAYFSMDEIINADNSTIVSEVDGLSLANLYRKYRDELFDENIRLYQGKGKASNKKIEKTILENPENFFIYNNGISAICKRFELGYNNKIDVTDIQVINGAQTICTLYEALKKGKEDQLRKVRVLFRLTQTSDQSLMRQITEANNSQEKVLPADFRSNDEIQLWLNERLSDFKYYGVEEKKVKPYNYMNKRQVPNRQCKNISFSELTKIMATIMLDPTVADGTKKLYDDSVTGNYWKIFGDDGLTVNHYEDNKLLEISAFIAIWFRSEYVRKKKIRELLKDNPELKDQAAHMAYQPRFHYLWSYKYIIEKFHNDKKNNIYQEIVEGMHLNDNGFVDVWLLEIFSKINTIYIGRMQSGFNWRNWRRNKGESTDILKDAIDGSPPTHFPI